LRISNATESPRVTPRDANALAARLLRTSKSCDETNSSPRRMPGSSITYASALEELRKPRKKR